MAEDEQAEELFEVETIVDTRTKDGVRYFKVRWKGYTPDDDTWEPEENVFECEDVLEEFWKRRRRNRERRRQQIQKRKLLAEKEEENKRKKSSTSEDGGEHLEKVLQHVEPLGMTRLASKELALFSLRKEGLLPERRDDNYTQATSSFHDDDDDDDDSQNDDISENNDNDDSQKDDDFRNDDDDSRNSDVDSRNSFDASRSEDACKNPTKVSSQDSRSPFSSPINKPPRRKVEVISLLSDTDEEEVESSGAHVGFSSGPFTKVTKRPKSSFVAAGSEFCKGKKNVTGSSDIPNKASTLKKKNGQLFKQGKSLFHDKWSENGEDRNSTGKTNSSNENITVSNSVRMSEGKSVFKRNRPTEPASVPSTETKEANPNVTADTKQAEQNEGSMSEGTTSKTITENKTTNMETLRKEMLEFTRLEAERKNKGELENPVVGLTADFREKKGLDSSEIPIDVRNLKDTMSRLPLYRTEKTLHDATGLELGIRNDDEVEGDIKSDNLICKKDIFEGCIEGKVKDEDGESDPLKESHGAKGSPKLAKECNKETTDNDDNGNDGDDLSRSIGGKIDDDVNNINNDDKESLKRQSLRQHFFNEETEAQTVQPPIFIPSEVTSSAGSQGDPSKEARTSQTVSTSNSVNPNTEDELVVKSIEQTGIERNDDSVGKMASNEATKDPKSSQILAASSDKQKSGITPKGLLKKFQVLKAKVGKMNLGALSNSLDKRELSEGDADKDEKEKCREAENKRDQEDSQDKYNWIESLDKNKREGIKPRDDSRNDVGKLEKGHTEADNEISSEVSQTKDDDGEDKYLNENAYHTRKAGHTILSGVSRAEDASGSDVNHKENACHPTKAGHKISSGLSKAEDASGSDLNHNENACRPTKAGHKILSGVSQAKDSSGGNEYYNENACQELGGGEAHQGDEPRELGDPNQNNSELTSKVAEKLKEKQQGMNEDAVTLTVSRSSYQNNGSDIVCKEGDDEEIAKEISSTAVATENMEAVIDKSSTCLTSQERNPESFCIAPSERAKRGARKTVVKNMKGGGGKSKGGKRKSQDSSGRAKTNITVNGKTDVDHDGRGTLKKNANGISKTSASNKKAKKLRKASFSETNTFSFIDNLFMVEGVPKVGKKVRNNTKKESSVSENVGSKVTVGAQSKKRVVQMPSVSDEDVNIGGMDGDLIGSILQQEALPWRLSEEKTKQEKSKAFTSNDTLEEAEDPLDFVFDLDSFPIERLVYDVEMTALQEVPSPEVESRNVPISRLKQAVRESDLDTIRAALASGYYDLERVDGLSGMSLLQWAAAAGQDTVVELLLRRRADVNATQRNGTTALMLACEQGSAETVDILLRCGACINMQTNKGETALIKACEKGQTDVVDILLRHGADTQLHSNSGLPVHQLARRSLHPELTSLLVEHETRLAQATEAAISSCAGGTIRLCAPPVFPYRCLAPQEGARFTFKFDFSPGRYTQETEIVVFCIKADFKDDRLLLTFSGDNGVRSVHLNGVNQLPILHGVRSAYDILPDHGQNELIINTHHSPARLIVCAYALKSKPTS